MKRLLRAARAAFFAATAAFVAAAFSVTSLSAAVPDEAAVKAYVTKALTRCPDTKITLEAIPQQGPRGFVIYAVTQTSSDTSCGRQTFCLVSPSTDQVMLGTIFPLANDARSVDVRVGEQASQLLKETLVATVSKFPLPDGLKTVSMVKQTKFGPFAYHGYVDASDRFLIVGMRGNMRTAPGKSLVESLGLENGVQRGNKSSAVQIVELSDLQCPTCARAHKALEPIISKNLDKIGFTRLDLPLFEHHEWSLQASLAARAINRVAPSQYWPYVSYVFENQENISKVKFDTFIKDYCDDRDIPWSKIQPIYSSPSEKQSLMDQASRAFDNAIYSTPTFIINGQPMGYGPEGTFTIQAVKDAIVSAGGKIPASAASSAPVKTPAAKKPAGKTPAKKKN